MDSVGDSFIHKRWGVNRPAAKMWLFKMLGISGTRRNCPINAEIVYALKDIRFVTEHVQEGIDMPWMTTPDNLVE